MSREEAMEALIESGMELRRDDIELGRQLERERIIKLLQQDICSDWTVTCCDGACSAYQDAINLIKGDDNGQDG